jgi:hypothetical protein
MTNKRRDRFRVNRQTMMRSCPSRMESDHETPKI